MELSTDQEIAAAVYNAQKASDLLPNIAAAAGIASSPADPAYALEIARVVAAFQARLGLVVDGKIGSQTRPVLVEELLQRPASVLWPPEAASPAEQNAHYARVCAVMGHAVRPDRSTLIGLRGVRLRGFSTHVVRSRPEYDDAFIILRPGNPPYEFRGATHAYQLTSKLSPDFDQDGKPDMGMVRPGRYLLRYAAKTVLVMVTEKGSSKLPAYRDTNHDGLFSPEEIAASIAAKTGAQVDPGLGAWADQVLFHPGPDGGRSSIACQTAAVASVEVLCSAAPIDYLLLDAVDVIDAVRAASAAAEGANVSDSMAKKIIEQCQQSFASTKADCNQFLKAVVNAFFEPDPFASDLDANQIVVALRASAEWTSLGKSHADAIRDAKAGLFVIAGMTASELGSDHGHVAAVVGDDGAVSGTVTVPICYAGSLNETARVERKRVSETFGAENARQGKISYFSRRPNA